MRLAPLLANGRAFEESRKSGSALHNRVRESAQSISSHQDRSSRATDRRLAEALEKCLLGRINVTLVVQAGCRIRSAP